jgi:hypothetical protein
MTANNNRNILIQWALNCATIVILGLIGYQWNTMAGELKDLQASVDALNKTVDRASTLDSLQTVDILTVRHWLHRHGDLSDVTFVFPEGQR